MTAAFEDLSRRDVLKLGAGAGAAGIAGAAGWGMLQGGSDAPTESLSGDEARRLAETYAPRLYFDTYEQWFPTDPRPYERERDGATVVDGFTALNEYTDAANETGPPPNPTVFYNAVAYEGSPLAVVQFWFYSVFDQFTTNFHWHDWEVLHVFHDRETGRPQLYVASAHSRSVPNNEFLDPDPTTQPRILSELGSHASALSLNERAETFQRVALGETIADITNLAVEELESLGEIPLAYGLPRDEIASLPYAAPELDGEPLHEDDRLPAVDATSLLDESLTVDEFTELVSPPTDLPDRGTGRTFSYGGNSNDADVAYELVPTTAVEHISDFTGPQLSFEFTVPEFGEDLIAKHITSAGAPWKDPRYGNPAADITEPVHRAELAERYDVIARPSGLSRIVAVVGRTVQNPDAPDGEGVTTEQSPIETVVLVESESTVVPTFRGVVAAQGLSAGEHRLTVNGAGYAPYSERVTVGADDEPTVAGADGTVALTAAEDAVKLQVDPRGTEAALTDLAVADDFAGRLYDAPLSGPDAVYVDRNGAYTTEVVDEQGERGAFRVNPDATGTTTIEQPDTGAASLASYVATLTAETATTVRTATGLTGDTTRGPSTGSAVTGLVRALEAVSEAAKRAADRAAAGDRAGTTERLRTARARLQRVADRLVAAREDLAEPVGNAVEQRLDQGRRRTRQALGADKL